MKLFIASVALATATISHGISLKGEPTPVERVVSLLQQLQAKIEDDGETESKIYDKYSCWCENTLMAKANDINASKKTIKDMQQMVLQMRGDSSVLASEITALNEDISKIEQSMRESASIRSKQHQSFLDESAEYKEAIGALQAAMKVLDGAGTGKKSTVQLLEIVPGIRRAALLASELRTRSAEMTVQQQATLSAFLKAPGDFYGSTASFNSFYTPQSSTLLGILKQMNDTFSANLATAEETENAAQAAFDELTATQSATIAVSQKSIADKTLTMTEKDQIESNSRTQMTNTQLVLEHDLKFFESSRDGCKAKADDWKERSRLRTEELFGIKKALAILTDDDSRALFGNTTSFLQISADSKAVSTRRHVSDILSAAGVVADDARIPVLAMQVASRIQGGADGDVVIPEDVFTAIQNMIAALKDEDAKDIKQKDWCFTETTTNVHTREDDEYSMQRLGARIDELDSRMKDTLDKRQVANETDISIAKQVVEATSQRQAQAAAYAQAKQDKEGAIALLGKAVEALTAYFRNNDVKTTLLLSKNVHYHHDKEASLVAHSAPVPSEEPKFARSIEDDPDAKFSDKTSKKQATDAIVALMTHLQTDLQRDLALATSAEEAAIADFAAAMKQAQEMREALQDQIADLTTLYLNTFEDKTLAQSSLNETTAHRDSVAAYLKTIKPSCDFISQSFDARSTKRQHELKGLQNAFAILKGAAGEREFEAPVEDKRVVEPAFLQYRSLLRIARQARRQTSK